jgi:hypothetical protein
MPNIQLNYLYRDGANYKQYGFAIFPNTNKLTVQECTVKIYSKLISNEFFVTQHWDLPPLQHFRYDPEIDHEWHEFESFELTNQLSTDQRDIEFFLSTIKKGNKI